MKSKQTLTLLSSIQQRIPENQLCCECSDASNPNWAVLLEAQNNKIGGFVCETCAIAHKSLGHEIKSITATVDGASWTSADVRAMAKGGNLFLNQIYEHALSNALETTIKPNSQSDLASRKLFLQLKYGQQKFYCGDDEMAHQLLLLNNDATIITNDSPSSNGSKKKKNKRPITIRQNSMPSLQQQEQNQQPKTPSRSGSRSLRRAHSNDDWDAAMLSPISTGVYSQSMSTISTKSTLFGSSKNRVQIAVKESNTGPKGSLDTFIELNNSMSQLDIRAAPTPILETNPHQHRSMRQLHFEANDKDTKPKMCRRVQSSRTLGEESYSYLEQEGGGGSNASKYSRSNRSGARRTKSLDMDQEFSAGGGGGSSQHQDLGYEQVECRPVRRRGSMGGSSGVRRKGSVESTQVQRESGGSTVRRRGSIGNAKIYHQPLSLEPGVVRRRGSLGGLSRRNSSVERLTGQHRANLSRRNLSLDSDDLKSPPNGGRVAQRRVSLTDSTPQRERPKYTRELSSSSIMGESNRSGRLTPEPPISHHHTERQAWMEGKTPRTTGRRKSMDNSLTNGKTQNIIDQSDRTQQRHNSGRLLGNTSNHGAAPGILRRGRSKRNFARQGSAKSMMDDTATSERSPKRSSSNSSLGNRGSSSSLKSRQGGLMGDQTKKNKRSSSKSSSRGLGSLRSSLGVQHTRSSSNDSSDLTSSRLGGGGGASTTQASSARLGSNMAVATAASTTRTPMSNDLSSKLYEIDQEAAMGGYNVFGNEHKSPTSPLTTSTASKRIPTSLHVLLHAQDDENRTLVSAMTGNTSLESHWSLHKERWKA